VRSVVAGLGGFMKVNLQKEMACCKIFTTGYFIRWSCRFAPAPSGETVPSLGCPARSARPSHTRTEAKK